MTEFILVSREFVTEFYVSREFVTEFILQIVKPEALLRLTAKFF